MNELLIHATVSAGGITLLPGARLTQGAELDQLIRQKLGGAGV